MEDLAIELADEARHHPCCGRVSTTVHGFLHDRSGETSVYFAGFTHGHPDVGANLALSVGGWGEGNTPEDRTAIALRAHAGGHEVELLFTPAESSPWFGEDFLGRMVEPDELSDDDRELCRSLARIVLAKDPRVAEYFRSASA